MIELPPGVGGAPVIRVDFTDDSAWSTVKSELLALDYNGSGFGALLEFIDAPELAGMDVETLEAQFPKHYPNTYFRAFVIVVDSIALFSAEHPVLLIDLTEENPALPFRALPREIYSIEVNLRIANLFFSEFRDGVRSRDGIFRGFA